MASYAKEQQKDLYIEDELSKPLYQRLIVPLWERISSALGRMTPKATYAMFEQKLALAGGFRGMGTDAFLMFWAIIAIVIILGFAIIGGKVFHLQPVQILSAGLLGFALALILPIVVLNQRIAARKAAMQKSLPSILDLIYVSVQAGMSFDSSLAKVAEKMKGPLVEEFTRALQEMRVGVLRRVALKNLADRCQIQDISLFTAALVQADQLGVSIANVLKVQADNVRKRRQLTIREMALKAPVKMLLPLVFLIFPTLFIVLLGPAFITLTRNLFR
jgi:tight adherence protein C